MPAYEIKKYYVRWSAATHSGYMMFYDANGAQVGSLEDSDISSPEELQFMWEMLRRESPVYFNTTSKRLYTSSLEAVGEEEP